MAEYCLSIRAKRYTTGPISAVISECRQSGTQIMGSHSTFPRDSATAVFLEKQSMHITFGSFVTSSDCEAGNCIASVAGPRGAASRPPADDVISVLHDPCAPGRLL